MVGHDSVQSHIIPLRPGHPRGEGLVPDLVVAPHNNAVFVSLAHNNIGELICKASVSGLVKRSLSVLPGEVRLSYLAVAQCIPIPSDIHMHTGQSR